MPTNEEAIMQMVREEFRKKYGSDSPKVLLDRATITSFENSTVTMEIASQFTYRILKERYMSALESTLSSLLGFPVKVNLVDTGAPTDVEKLKRQLTRDAFGHTADEEYEAQKKAEEQAAAEAEASRGRGKPERLHRLRTSRLYF